MGKGKRSRRLQAARVEVTNDAGLLVRPRLMTGAIGSLGLAKCELELRSEMQRAGIAIAEIDRAIGRSERARLRYLATN
jgi:hypothetical protein